MLAEFLPPKQEFVLAVRITPLQYSLYRYYLDHIAGNKSVSAFPAWNFCPDGCVLFVCCFFSASGEFNGGRWAGQNQRKPVQRLSGAQSNLEPPLVSAAQLAKKGLGKHF